jgi:hypothetical protein
MAVTSGSGRDPMNENKGRLMSATVLDPIKDRQWTPEDVSVFLGVPVPTLYQWRHRGVGPKSRRVGRHLRTSPTMYGPGLKTRRERWDIPRTCGPVRRQGQKVRPFAPVTHGGAKEDAGLHAGRIQTDEKDRRSSRSRPMPTGTGEPWRPTRPEASTMTPTLVRH